MALALQHPELYLDKVKDVGEPIESSTKCASCNFSLPFIDEDLLLGSKPHNQPLFVFGYIFGQRVNHILMVEVQLSTSCQNAS